MGPEVDQVVDLLVLLLLIVGYIVLVDGVVRIPVLQVLVLLRKSFEPEILHSHLLITNLGVLHVPAELFS